ncbi:MAG: flippase [bacterium]|nr:flippase [bacterium]
MIDKLVHRVREELRKGIVKNILWLYLVHIVNYLIPLITIPYLTRTLGREGWGVFAFFQSFALYITSIVDFNFIQSGTREVSRFRDDKWKRSQIVAGVIGAKLLLSVGLLLICIPLQQLLTSFRTNPLIFWMGIVWAISLGFSFVWYFQGMEKMKWVALLDFLAKGLATVAIFFFIHEPDDVWLVFLFYSIANIVSMLFAAMLAYREMPFVLPTIALSWQMIRLGLTLFFSRMSINFYSTANVFVLGLFTSPAQVGIFAGADKLGKAFCAITAPITYATFPRMSHTLVRNRDEGRKLIIKSSLLMFSSSAVLSLFNFVIAPYYTKYYLGAGFEEATEVLRWQSLLILTGAMSNVFAVQWLLPLGFDKMYNRITIISAAAHIVLAAWLATRFGAVGMAWTVILTELLVVICTLFVLSKRKLLPWNPQALHENTNESNGR